MSWLLLTGLVTSARADGLGAIPVCVRPPDVPPGLDGWAFAPNGTTVVRMKREEFQKQSRGQLVYIFNPAAPPENIKLLPVRYHHLTCPPYVPPAAPPAATAEKPATAPPPAPPSSGSGSASMPSDEKPATPDKHGLPPGTPVPQPIVYPNEEPEPRPHPPSNGITAQWQSTVLPVVRRDGDTRTKVLPVATMLPVVRREELLPSVSQLPPANTLLPMKGQAGSAVASSRGGTGDAPNKVAKKTAFEKLAEEMAYAGAIANQQFNEDIKRPDGKQYGIPGGKSAKGPNNAVAQAAAGAVLVVAGVLSAGAGGFKKKLVAALKKGEPMVYKEAAELSEKAAEELAKKYGYKITHALNVNGSIGPYSVMRKFTDNLGAKWQAHHILEVKGMKDFKLGNPDLGPSVVLTDAEHKALTAKLKLATAQANTAKKLWKAYQDVYRDHPHWLEAIKPYFVKAK